ncbi:MAG: penicillin acylase family protein [Caldilineaceae bacterium]
MALDVAGASLPGVPGVFIGHNAAVAWGVTNALVDVQDLCLERLHPEKRGVLPCPAAGNPPASAPRRSPSAAPPTWRRSSTAQRPAHHRAVAGRGRRGPNATAAPLSALDRPGAGDDAARAAAPQQGRRLGRLRRGVGRLVRAARQRDLRRHRRPHRLCHGRACAPPQRRQPGPHPRARLERRRRVDALDPPRRTAQAARSGVGRHRHRQQQNGGRRLPHFLGVEFMPGWRAARIEEMLGKRARHALRDMEEIQLDVRSKYAEALAPWIGLVDSDDPWEKTALNAMRTWSYHMEPDSTAALVFHYTVLELLQMVFGDKVGAARDGFLGETISPLFPTNGFMSRAELRLLQLIDEHETSVWYADAATDTPRTRDELLQQAFTRAVRTIRATVGDSARKWDWGRSHQIRYVHPLGSARFLRGFFNRGPFPIGGDGTTPLQTRHAPRLPLGLVQITPSYRQLVDVGNWDRGMSVTTAGQSGHPFSDHYDDQMTMFREGVYHRMPWSRAAVDEAAVYRMRLVRG